MAALSDKSETGNSPAPDALGREKPIAALCILCHDADAVLPFYRDVLGFEPRRAEESFYHFARRGSATALCLWEIGHVASHTVYTEHSPATIPNKFVVSLTVPSGAHLANLRDRLAHAEGVQILAGNVNNDAGNLFFIDPCAVIWDVSAESAPNDDHSLAVHQITLLCQDFAVTQAFYQHKLAFPEADAVNGRVTYPAVPTESGTALSLWDVNSAATYMGLPTLPGQHKQWHATTAMLAYSFDKLETVREHYQSLQRAGVHFDEAPQHFDWDFSACYFCDTEHNIWELFETPSNIEQRMLPQTGGK